MQRPAMTIINKLNIVWALTKIFDTK